MDNDNIDLKNIWQQQKVSQPNIEDLLNRIRKFKKSSLRRLIFSNIMLIGTSIFIVFIWYSYQSELITTKIGLIITVLAMVIFLFSYNKLFTFLNKIDNTQTNSQYLENLSSIKSKQKFMQTTMLSIYYIMLSIGVCLYMYESASRMTTAWAIFAYSITLIWIGFSWFYIRPKTIRKQQSKLDELISKFESINQQLQED